MGKILKSFFLLCSFSICLLTSISISGDYTAEELEEGVVEEKTIDIIDQGYYYNVKKTVVKGDITIVLGGFDDGTKTFTSYTFHTYPYIACYEKEALKWYKSFKEYGYGNLVDVVFTEEGYTVVGEAEDETNVSGLIFLKFDMEGNVLKYSEKRGHLNTFPNGIFKYRDSYFVTGWTLADNLGDSVYNHNGSCFVALVDKDLSFNDVSFFGNDGKNEVYQSIMVDDIIYIYMRVVGDGYYKNPRTEYIILGVSIYLEKYMHEEVTKADASVFLKECFSKPYLFLFNKEEDTLSIYPNLTKNTSSQVIHIDCNSLNYVAECLDISYYEDDNNELVLLTQTIRNETTNNYYVKCTTYNEEFDEVFTLSKPTTSSRLYTVGYLSEGYFYVFGVSGNTKPNTMYGSRLSYVKTENGEAYFNGCLATKTIIDETGTAFGDYTGRVEYTLNDMQITITTTITIPPEVSVKNQEVYDLNHVLTFNGEGYLNNQLITSGYEIDKEGVYLLEVKGVSSSIYFTFEVKDLCINLDCAHTYSSVEITEEKQANEIVEVVKVNYGDIDYEVTTSTRIDNYLVVVLAGIMGITIGLFIPLWRKKDE